MNYVLSIGSNIGNKIENIVNAKKLLKEKGVFSELVSSLYETSPVDYFNQDNFYNIAVVVNCDFMPDELMRIIHSTEAELMRERTVPKGPRTIDIDIIFWSEGNYISEILQIPHPSFDKRLFVMVPVYEILRERSFFWQERIYMQERIAENKKMFTDQKIISLGSLPE